VLGLIMLALAVAGVTMKTMHCLLTALRDESKIVLPPLLYYSFYKVERSGNKENL